MVQCFVFKISLHPKTRLMADLSESREVCLVNRICFHFGVVNIFEFEKKLLTYYVIVRRISGDGYKGGGERWIAPPSWSMFF